MAVNAGFCPADESVIEGAIPLLPGSWERLAAQSTDPFRSRGPSSGGRRPPGSRVLVSSADDALLREAASHLSGWAARVRAVPGIDHSARQHDPGTLEGVAESCGVLARWTTQLLALPPGPVTRTWEYAPGRHASAPPLPSLHAMAEGMRTRPRSSPAVPCRRCGIFVTPSPSGRFWWPAVCSHAVVEPSAWREDKDGSPVAVAWACTECGTPFRGKPPARRPPCAHEPSGPPPERSGGIPADIEAEIEGLEVVRAGDGWVTVITEHDGIDAGLDILGLAAKFRRLLGESPARPESLDGIPCRDCEEMSSLVRADPPSDPSAKAPHSRCTSCGDLMDRDEYDEWVKQYNAYAKGGGKPPTCRRCEMGNCSQCCWAVCSCAEEGHPRAA